MEAVQPDAQSTWVPEPGAAVSPTEAPTGNAAMHLLPPVPQLMPPVVLVTFPFPVTWTLKLTSVPPPGQSTSAGLFTVTVATAVTTLLEPPVPSGILTRISATPQGPAVPGGEVDGGGVALNKPGVDMVATPLSIVQVAWLVTSLVAGG